MHCTIRIHALDNISIVEATEGYPVGDVEHDSDPSPQEDENSRYIAG